MDSPVQGVSFMRKSVFVLAVIGAACSSVAFAAEVKKDKAHIPAVKATTMSDSDMDKVTAGFNVGQEARVDLGIGPSPGFERNGFGASNGAFVFPRGQCSKYPSFC
jgi:hypothetical protein